MKNINQLFKKIANEDETFEFLKNHYYKINNEKYSPEFQNIFPFLNKILLNLKSDLIIVTPNKKELAFLTGIFSSLFFFKNKFNERYENFKNWLLVGSNVKLCSSEKETGKVYKYLGPSNEIKNNIKLGSVNGKFNFIDFPVNTIFQLCPTNLEKPAGDGKKIPIPKLKDIDFFLGINGYGNPLLYEDRIVILTNTYKSFDNFLNKEKIIHKNFEIENYYGELISCAKLNKDGSFEKKKDPLILYSNSLDCIYEYYKNKIENKIIISDRIKELNNNFAVYNQIKNINKNINFVIFAEEHEQDLILEFYNKKPINIWKLNREEIKNLFHRKFNDNKNEFNINKIITKSDFFLNKKNIFIDTGDNLFNKIDLQLKKIIKIQNTVSNEVKDLLKDILSEMYVKMYFLRDHIFGFNEEIQNDFEDTLKRFTDNLNSRKSFLDQYIIDDIESLKKLFLEIPKFGKGLFDKRANELKEILKLRNSTPKEKYALLVNSAKIKQYYKKNIKEKWNLNPEIIYSINNSGFYNNIIIPSELSPDKIKNLLLNNNFENLFFLGGRNLQEELNKKKIFLKKNWIKTAMSAEKKCEILNINNNLSHILSSQDDLEPNSKYADEKFTGSILENFFHYSVNDLLNKDAKSPTEKNVLALPVIFNGSCYSYITKNFNTEIFNNIFNDISEKKNKIVTFKNYTNLDIDDIIFLRDSVDRNVLESVSIEILNNSKEEYAFLKSETLKISSLINLCFGKNFKKKDVAKYLLDVGYDRDINNVISISNPNEGTICPNKFIDLQKIFLACEKKNPVNFSYNINEAKQIFVSAQKLKQLHKNAGKVITNKLKNAIKNLNDFDFDGDPLRVDYDNNEIIIGSDVGDNPEGWIVQIKAISKIRELKEVKMSLTNKINFL